jgi:hypothetical protein
MRLRFKYIWYLILFAWGVLAFFEVPIPNNWKSAMSLLTFFDNWLFAHAAHPTLLALFVGLVIGTIIIPEGWRVLKSHIVPDALTPNMKISEAIDYIVNDSIAKLEQSSPPKVFDFGPAKERVVTEMGKEHQDARTKLNAELISGELKSWGLRQIKTHIPNQFEHSLREIPREYWDDMQLDFQSCLYYSKSLPQTMKIPGRSDNHNWWQIQVSKKQIQKMWPPKSLLSRLYAKITKQPRISYGRSYQTTL